MNCELSDCFGIRVYNKKHSFIFLPHVTGCEDERHSRCFNVQKKISTLKFTGKSSYVYNLRKNVSYLAKFSCFSEARGTLGLNSIWSKSLLQPKF